MIPYGRHHLDDDDIRAVVEVLESGALTQGPRVEVFEKTVAKYVGARYAVAVSSGTAALHLCAVAAGLAPGMTLVTTPITFVASANAAQYVGADVAFADIDPETINLSPDALALTLQCHENVRAVIPVHFAGLPCDMARIRQLANAAGAMVIEDAAHALGACYEDGARVGSCAHSDMTIFSFHPVKAVAAGEGGMITTNDDAIYRRLIRLRSHGINKLDDPFELPKEAYIDGRQNPWYYEMQELGYHYRITDIQCGLALSQFCKLEKFITRRRSLVERYDVALEGIPWCRPAQLEGRDISGHHLYVLRIDYGALGMDRGEVMNNLKRNGIGSQVHYIPVPAQPFYRRLGHDPAAYPASVSYYEQALSIPLFYDLTDVQQDEVIAAIKGLDA